jgi:hypothetical protein
MSVKIKVTKKKEVTYKLGDKFKNGREIYVLSQVDSNMVCLIGFKGGNRWENPIQVKDCNCITTKEFSKITSNQIEDFTPINITITED